MCGMVGHLQARHALLPHVLAQAVGHVFYPHATVHLAMVEPCHCAWALSPVKGPGTSVAVATWVNTYALAMLHIILPVT